MFNALLHSVIDSIVERLPRPSATLPALQSGRILCCSMLLALSGCSDRDAQTTATIAADRPDAGSEEAADLAAAVSAPPEINLTPAPESIGPLRHPTTVLVLGDSISAAYGIQREQGWVALLETQVKRVGSEHRVVNASISGDTTGGGLARLPTALSEHQPDLVVVELGGNDGLRGYPAERIRANLAGIIEAAHAAGARVLLVGMQIPPNYGPRYGRAFADTFESLAAQYELDWVPGFLEDVALAGNLMQADGIHPKAVAQPMLLEAIWPAIAKFLKSRR